MNSVVDFPIALSETSSAPLPQVYEAARAALAECEEIDECKTWLDKAVAIASYARQAQDDGLRVMAVRIQARAERRCGELLKQIEAQPGKRTNIEPSGGVPTRLQTAIAAGMSKDQMIQSLRMAHVPNEEFDAQVESDDPPTVTHLARQGKTTRALYDNIAPSQAMPAACAALIDFVKCCEKHEPVGLARTFGAEDAAVFRQWVAKANHWLVCFSSGMAE